MLPWKIIDKARAPEGGELILYERNGEYSIRVDGLELMSSRAYGSEGAMARFGCEHLRNAEAPNVLIGGLGLGFTLRATLDVLPAGGHVVMAELVPAVVEWNRSILGFLAQNPLADPRVEVAVGDVGKQLEGKARYDAILLDVDNGPTAFTSQTNNWLYTAEGLRRAHQSLRPGGSYVVWSAGPDEAFEKRMRKAGFAVETHRVSARGTGGGTHHTLFVGTR